MVQNTQYQPNQHSGGRLYPCPFLDRLHEKIGNKYNGSSEEINDLLIDALRPRTVRFDHKTQIINLLGLLSRENNNIDEDLALDTVRKFTGMVQYTAEIISERYGKKHAEQYLKDSYMLVNRHKDTKLLTDYAKIINGNIAQLGDSFDIEAYFKKTTIEINRRHFNSKETLEETILEYRPIKKE